MSQKNYFVNSQNLETEFNILLSYFNQQDLSDKLNKQILHKKSNGTNAHRSKISTPKKLCQCADKSQQC